MSNNLADFESFHDAMKEYGEVWHAQGCADASRGLTKDQLLMLTERRDSAQDALIDEIRRLPILNQMHWQPIETAPSEVDILLAAHIVPSEEAQRNGAQPFWEIVIGAKYCNIWCRVLGGKPSHWMPLPLPPQPSAGL